MCWEKFLQGEKDRNYLTILGTIWSHMTVDAWGNGVYDAKHHIETWSSYEAVSIEIPQIQVKKKLLVFAWWDALKLRETILAQSLVHDVINFLSGSMWFRGFEWC